MVKYIVLILIIIVSSLNANLEKAFTNIYHNWSWGKNEKSVSGSGSSLQQTERVRLELPKLLKQLNIKFFLDAPCGDFFWMREVDLSFLDEYIGIDIVAPLIKVNQAVYETKQNDLSSVKGTIINFLHADITNDPLPKVDLVLCRDCLVHFTYETIKNTINNFKKAGIRYLLTTTFPDRTRNDDLKLDGGWRVLNLQEAPFYFPDPIVLINEGCTEFNGRFKDKSLGLWDLNDIQFG